jgi:hypothetical protein
VAGFENRYFEQTGTDDGFLIHWGMRAGGLRHEAALIPCSATKRRFQRDE